MNKTATKTSYHRKKKKGGVADEHSDREEKEKLPKETLIFMLIVGIIQTRSIAASAKHLD